tara:strand:- start:1062 stop:1214 length:153 start_codon:yes stop_codon:yes gene_type:complete
MRTATQKKRTNGYAKNLLKIDIKRRAIQCHTVSPNFNDPGHVSDLHVIDH